MRCRDGPASSPVTVIGTSAADSTVAVAGTVAGTGGPATGPGHQRSRAARDGPAPRPTRTGGAAAGAVAGEAEGQRGRHGGAPGEYIHKHSLAQHGTAAA